jgi:hypothetical protein
LVSARNASCPQRFDRRVRQSIRRVAGGQWHSRRETGFRCSPAQKLSAPPPTSRAIYKQLLAAIKPIGPYREEIKKTSIHLVRKSAFAGVHPRSQHLLLTIKAEKSIRSPRAQNTFVPLSGNSGSPCEIRTL